jgi:WD40 repeat protein
MPLSVQPYADHGVFVTLSGHGGLVTCVEFIDDRTILSADDTGSLRLWRNSDSSVRVVHGYAVQTLMLNFSFAQCR